MVEPTQRDEVWSNSLTKALQQGENITPADIAKLTDVSERVCRETMYIMHTRGWLNRALLNVRRRRGGVHNSRSYCVRDRFLESEDAIAVLSGVSRRVKTIFLQGENPAVYGGREADNY